MNMFIHYIGFGKKIIMNPHGNNMIDLICCYIIIILKVNVFLSFITIVLKNISENIVKLKTIGSVLLCFCNF